MTHKALIRRLQISCLGLDHVDPLRLLVDDVIEALRENAMREVQRLGQEIEQEPVAFEKTVCPFCTSEWVTAEQHDRNVDRVEREDVAEQPELCKYSDYEPDGVHHNKPPQRPRVMFPTMLRKMWSGSEVQAWLDENVNKENT